MILSGFALNLVGMALIAAPSLLALRWRTAWQLTRSEAAKLLSEPTHGSRFWERPAIAALLSKTARVQRHALTVEGMSRAIADMAAAFPSAARSLARDAVLAASELAREVKAVDARIAEVATQVDPAERQRLQERIAQLGPDRSTDADVTRQMRSLLRGQEELFSALASREKSLRADRNRLFDHLRGLHLQVVSYSSQLAGQDNSDVLSEKIREVTRQIERRVEATKWVNG